MTWKNLRPKILARHDFSGYAGKTSWDSFKSFVLSESSPASLSRSQSIILAIWFPRSASLRPPLFKNSGFKASPGLVQTSPCIKPKLSIPKIFYQFIWKVFVFSWDVSLQRCLCFGDFFPKVSYVGLDLS